MSFDASSCPVKNVLRDPCFYCCLLLFFLRSSCPAILVQLFVAGRSFHPDSSWRVSSVILSSFLTSAEHGLMYQNLSSSSMFAVSFIVSIVSFCHPCLFCRRKDMSCVCPSFRSSFLCLKRLPLLLSPPCDQSDHTASHSLTALPS